MAQMNLNVTPEFGKTLARFMKLRSIKTKSEAIRMAVEEGVARARAQTRTDFRGWLGMGIAATQNPAPRFASDDDLWTDR